MPALDLEAEYNNRRRVPAHAEHAARWQAASAAYRRAAKDAELDLAPAHRRDHVAAVRLQVDAREAAEVRARRDGRGGSPGP